MRKHSIKNSVWDKQLLKNTMFCCCAEIRSSSRGQLYWFLTALETCELCLGSGISPIPSSEFSNFYPKEVKKCPEVRYNLIQLPYMVYEAITEN